MERAAELARTSFGEGFEDAAELTEQVMDAYKEYVSDFEDEFNAALDGVKDKMAEVESLRAEMEQRLASYGELMQTVTISWSDGSQSEFAELSNLQSQIDTLQRYGDTLTQLRERGISDSLLAETSAMDVDELIEYGGLLLSLTDEQWEEYNAKWEEKQQLAREIADNFYKDELDALEQEYTQLLADGLEELQDISYTSGQQTVQGLIDGMRAREKELQAQAERMAAIVASAVKSELQIASPSKLMKEYGKFTAQGLEIGFADEIDRLQAIVTASIPTSFELPPSPANTGMAQSEAVVNAIGTLMSGLGGQSANGDLVVVFNLNGTEFARATVNDFRAIEAQEPVVVDDF